MRKRTLAAFTGLATIGCQPDTGLGDHPRVPGA